MYYTTPRMYASSCRPPISRPMEIMTVVMGTALLIKKQVFFVMKGLRMRVATTFKSIAVLHSWDLLRLFFLELCVYHILSYY